MTAQLRIAAGELPRALGGSNRAHEDLQRACLNLLALWRVPAVPIHTGPRVRPREGGGWDLRPNPEQRGFADIAACLPPAGLLAMLELKSGRAVRKPHQLRMAARFERAGAVCAVIRDVRDLEALLKLYLPRPAHGGKG